MSKRYGRNQRRKARQTISNLTTEVVATRAQASRAHEQTIEVGNRMHDWARRIVARLGYESAFALDKVVREWNGQGRIMAHDFEPFRSVHDRLEEMADSFTQDLITLFVHHVESTYDKRGGRELKGQLVLHLYRGPDHTPLYIALSAHQMDEIRYSKDPEYMEFLVRGLAYQFAKHAEEMQRG